MRRHRHSQFNAASMKPIDRRREVVAILARGLARIDHACEKISPVLPNRPCFPRQDTAQCDDNAAGVPPPESWTPDGDIDEVT